MCCNLDCDLNWKGYGRNKDVAQVQVMTYLFWISQCLDPRSVWTQIRNVFFIKNKYLLCWLFFTRRQVLLRCLSDLSTYCQNFNLKTCILLLPRGAWRSAGAYISDIKLPRGHNFCFGRVDYRMKTAISSLQFDKAQFHWAASDSGELFHARNTCLSVSKNEYSQNFHSWGLRRWWNGRSNFSLI